MKRLFLFCLICCLGLPLTNSSLAPLEVQGATHCNELFFNATAVDFLDSANYEVEYCFEGTMGDVVQITLVATSGNLDSYLYLYDDPGSLLKEDDDGFGLGTTDAYIEYTLPANGYYFIYATRYDGSAGTTSGDFQLDLVLVSSSGGTGTGSGGTGSGSGGTGTGSGSSGCPFQLSYASRSLDSLDSVNYTYTYCFMGTVGDVVQISLVAITGNLDAYLYLEDDSGGPLAEDDDSYNLSSGTDAYIEYTLPYTGEYFVYATRYDGSAGTTSGDYELYLALASSGGTGTGSGGSGAGAPCSNEIFYSNTVFGFIDSTNFGVEYCFNGTAGDNIQISMAATTGNLDTYLNLSDGVAIFAEDDDGLMLGGTDSYIEFTLPTDGYYFIYATRYDNSTGTTSGDFQLNLTLISNTGSTGLSCIPLTYGTSVTGTISASVSDPTYCFTGQANDIVYVSMSASSSSTIDPFFSLTDSTFQNLVQNDTDVIQPGSTTAGAGYILPANGTYYVYPESSNSNSGNFELGVYVQTIPNFNCTEVIADGSVVMSNIDNTDFQRIYCFNAQAGDTVYIYMEATSGDLDSFLSLTYFNDPIQLQLIENDDDPSNPGTVNAFFEYVIPASDVYELRAARLDFASGFTSGNFTLYMTLVPSTGTVTPPGTGTGTGDTDGDGVPDTVDVCPAQGSGLYGLNQFGCPVDDAVTACSLFGSDCGDNDGDGYPNDFDTCPNANGGPPNGCPATINTPPPISSTGGIQVFCDNGQQINNGALISINMRSGFNYTATAVGLNGFDPVLAVLNADGRAICNDDNSRADEYRFNLPTTGTVDANGLSSRVSFSFNRSLGEYGNVQLVVGNFNGTAGEYVLFLEGMVVTKNDPPGDPFSIELTQNVLNYPTAPSVYMIGVQGGLDPFVKILDDNYNEYVDLSGNIAYCDDAGDGYCWGNQPQLLSYFVQTSNTRTLPADRLDAAITLNNMPSPITPRLNFLMTSAVQSSLGEYIVVFHLGTQ